MPEPSTGAREALKTPARASRRSVALRVAIGAVLALSVLAIPEVAEPGPATAASSCTGWTSHASPPRTIRVLNSRSGQVQTVAFRKYVAQVMASGEWPTRLRLATLEAGAIATKQYGWYYAMEGNHRSGYVAGGKCYDVADTTSDQLYRHWAKPTARQQKAVDRTWDLTLRKNNRFFLTGYRQGTNGTCAADANGWKLFERSIDACARKGWSSTRILRTYLGPNFKIVRSDTMGPVLKDPTLRLESGNVLPGAATIDWGKLSSQDQIAGYRVQRRTGGSEWKSVDLDFPRAKTADVWLRTGKANRFRVRARDLKGEFGPWAYSPVRKAAIRGPKGISLAGSDATVSSAGPRKVKVRFKGRSAAFVTEVGPDMGRAKIFVNGRKVAVIDLQRDRSVERKLVWAKNWSKKKERVIVVKAANPAQRVVFDGIFTLR